MCSTFYGAAAFNSDISKWNTSSVNELEYTFSGAASFTGTGVDLWNINKVKTMGGIFKDATALTSCNKRKIADAWKSNAAFTNRGYDTDWAADTCQQSVSTVSLLFCV
jgi:surface protein